MTVRTGRVFVFWERAGGSRVGGVWVCGRSLVWSVGTVRGVKREQMQWQYQMPPGFPLQTHSLISLSFLSYVSFLSLLTSVSVAPSFRTDSLICVFSSSSPLSSVTRFTWLLDLFCCCLYIFLLFLKFHLYYILGPRDHPDIVDSFMQLQAQVCFWFLISFTLGFTLSLAVFLRLFLLPSVRCHRLFFDPRFARPEVLTCRRMIDSSCGEPRVRTLVKMI